ncbi:MAG: apolipoprotein N-acyltransferase [Sedimentisphaerales bacterium]
MSIQNTKGILRLLTAFAGTAIMLTLAQQPIGWWPLAWVAYVPFVLACFCETKPFKLYLTAFVVSTCYWLGNIYWMSFVTVVGWITFCLYTALLWPILALSLRWCIKKRVPLFIAVPVLIVGIEQMQGFFLGGFYWNHLAHSQFTNTALIQIADIFGAAGVSFVVAMVNGLVAEMLLVRRPWFVVRNVIIAGIVLVGTLGYGQWRINQSAQFVTPGPMIAAVQTNIPISVKKSFAAEKQIFDELLGQSNQCIPAGAKLVVWPETMVQAILNQQVLRLLVDDHSYKIFDETIREHAKKGAYILAGAYDGTPRYDADNIRLAQKFNSAFLYKPDGSQAPQKYSKIYLVPFGEMLPFSNIPLVHKLFLKMSPYDFDYTIDPGTEYTVFEMQPRNSNRIYTFSVMICYEDAVPFMARKFTLDERGNKQINWLVNISNDGWFVRFKNGKVLPATELSQHAAICAFRAVENRLAVLRSVNTGISCMVDTLGRIKDGYAAGNLPQKAFDRQGVTGWFADTVPIDARTTFFSKHGQWLDFACQLSVVVIIIAQIAERFFLKRRTKDEKGSKINGDKTPGKK